jgi:hypothetical protein
MHKPHSVHIFGSGGISGRARQLSSAIIIHGENTAPLVKFDGILDSIVWDARDSDYPKFDHITDKLSSYEVTWAQVSQLLSWAVVY